jgi:uncharacterized membrane protein YccC
VSERQDTDDLLPELGLADVMRQRPAGIGSLRLVLRVAVAVTISWAIAVVVSQSTLGIFAPITTLIVIQASPWSTLGVSIQRILGTGLGVLAASLWVNAVGLTWWSFLLGVLAALLVARALPWSSGGQLQIPIAVVFVLSLGAGSLASDMWRVIDVVIGGVVGIVAVFVFPPRPRPEAFDRALEEYRDAIIETLRTVGRESGSHASPLADDVPHDYVLSSRGLRARAETARAELVRLVESSHFNLRAGGVAAGTALRATRLRRLSGIGLQVRGIAGAANRLYDREGAPAILAGSSFAALVELEAELMEAVLGAHGQPLAGTDRAVAERRDHELQSGLRRTADDVAAEHGGVGGVLESIALLGRLDHVRVQIADYPSWGD